MSSIQQGPEGPEGQGVHGHGKTGGLHGFWQSGVNHQRIINSFELIGATTLVDPLNASRWCETRSEDRDDYSETEADYLATIEEELAAGMDELIELVLEFIEEELA